MPLNGQKKCDILILSANLGTGHYQVSNAIQKVLKKEKPQMEIVIYDFFDHVEPLLKHLIRFSYEQSIKHFTYGYELYYEATRNLGPDSKLYQTLHTVGRQRLKQTMEKLKPDIVVCTFPNPAGVISMIKNRENIDIPLITIITDVAVHAQWIHPKVDAYLVASDEVADGLRKMGVSADAIHITGIPLREGFEKQSVSGESWHKYALDQDKFTLMMMGGGSGLISGTESICSKLSTINLPMQIIAITGANRSLHTKLSLLAEQSRMPIRVLGYVENIAELMEMSDLLLTKAGGVTIFEALAKGLPMVLHNPLPGHESGNVSFLIEHNAAVLADSENSAVKIIEHFVNNQSILDSMKNSIRFIAKPCASHDAAKIILKYLESGHSKPIKPSKPKSKLFSYKNKYV